MIISRRTFMASAAATAIAPSCPAPPGRILPNQNAARFFGGWGVSHMAIAAPSLDFNTAQLFKLLAQVRADHASDNPILTHRGAT